MMMIMIMMLMMMMMFIEMSKKILTKNIKEKTKKNLIMLFLLCIYSIVIKHSIKHNNNLLNKLNNIKTSRSPFLVEN
jgi:hypothetical protein